MIIKPLYRLILLTIGLLTGISVSHAQQFTAPDTSFTFYSAYQGVKKTNPEASIPVINTGDTVSHDKDVFYEKVNGRKLLLDIFYPSRKYYKGTLPAVIMIHGGGWRTGNRQMHQQMAMKIAARGYVVITVQYRLSTEALYPAAVNDIKSAIKGTRESAWAYRIDPKKMAIWGFSAGGQLAALVGTTADNRSFPGDGSYSRQTDVVQAIIDVDGILAFIHPESAEGDDSKRTSSATYWFGSPKTAQSELWQQASALNHVNKHTPPILFLNSSVDRMHAGRDDMIKKLDSLHIYHEVHTFKGAPHSFNMFEPWFTPTLNYTVAFLDKLFKSK